MKKEGRWFTAQHRGTLKDSLETEKPISNCVAKKLISSGLYRAYAYDYRIEAHVFILNFDLGENLGLPAYLHFYGETKVRNSN